ncbi:MAG: HEAT repeat domain-containing protein [Candidatus Margulisbacteria bacterium]|nr:HEAT repeat domain-containing protein [Candidatus Margulisiibacteriota bacterium]
MAGGGGGAGRGFIRRDEETYVRAQLKNLRESAVRGEAGGEIAWHSREALGRVLSEGAADIFIEALRDRHEVVRVTAAENLKRLGDREAIDALQKVIQKPGESSWVKKTAEAAIDEIKLRNR